MRINILTVNYKSKDFIENLLKKINEENIPHNLFVINNSEESFKDIKEKYKNVYVIKNNLKISNPCLSHVSGLNLGLSCLNFNNNYTLICDPDVSFSKGALRSIITYMESDNLDVFGITKHSKKYPYIWFTIIKTKYLKDFYFLYLPIIDNILIKAIRKLMRKLGVLPDIEDSGDSIYELIKNKKLKYVALTPVSKDKLPNKYNFLKQINSTDYIWKGHVISHFNCGSDVRYNRLHKERDKEIFFKL